MNQGTGVRPCLGAAAVGAGPARDRARGEVIGSAALCSHSLHRGKCKGHHSLARRASQKNKVQGAPPASRLVRLPHWLPCAGGLSRLAPQVGHGRRAMGIRRTCGFDRGSALVVGAGLLDKEATIDRYCRNHWVALSTDLPARTVWIRTACPRGFRPHVAGRDRGDAATNRPIASPRHGTLLSDSDATGRRGRGPDQ